MVRHAVCLVAVIALTGAVGRAAGDEGTDDVPSNDVEVVQPPTPEYPGIAAFAGLEGYCEVEFSLFDYGNTLSIEGLSCSHLIFCKSASDGMKAARFRITDVPGAPFPGARDSIVYPVEFAMEDGGEFNRDKVERINCLGTGAIM
ncbi:MAG: hypothetical protein VYC38_03360 [Pseudomonadota bacterium]|nr:hypothetical protein [Pseudomonadota bacterium]